MIFCRYGPQQLGFALGDVSGKGSAAALYGAVATGILRSIVPQKLQPAELLKQLELNSLCERQNRSAVHDVLFCDMAKGAWQIAHGKRGAESQPLLWKDGRCGLSGGYRGTSRGCTREATYDEVNFTLEAGDILVFHSDGLSESMNSAGRFFRHRPAARNRNGEFTS